MGEVGPSSFSDENYYGTVANVGAVDGKTSRNE